MREDNKNFARKPKQRRVYKWTHSTTFRHDATIKRDLEERAVVEGVFLSDLIREFIANGLKTPPWEKKEGARNGFS